MVDTVPKLMQVAVSQQQAGNLSTATEHCLAVLALVPEYPDALYLLGILHAQRKAYAIAEDYFARAIQANPVRAEFYGNYANALLEQGKLVQAITLGQQSIALNPRQFQCLHILGNAYLLQGDFTQAADYFQQVIALNPRFAPAHNKLGITWQRQQRYNEAIRCLQTALSLQADYPEAQYHLGLALQESGQIAAAYQCYRQLLASHPEDASAQRGLLEVDPAWLMPLTGKSIVLRRFEESDSDFLSQSYATEAFMRFYHHYLPRQLSSQQLAAKLSIQATTHPYQHKAIDWIIWRSVAGRPTKAIGIANLVDIQFAHRRAEFLLGIPASADRSHYAAVEASLLVMDFAFNQVQLNKLTSYVYASNPLAQKNTEALGFSREGYLEAQILHLASGEMLDLYVNGLTVAAFRRNARLARLSLKLLGRDITLRR